MFPEQPTTPAALTAPDSLAALVAFLQRLDGATVTVTIRLAAGSTTAPVDPGTPPKFTLPGS